MIEKQSIGKLCNSLFSIGKLSNERDIEKHSARHKISTIRSLRAPIQRVTSVNHVASVKA